MHLLDLPDNYFTSEPITMMTKQPMQLPTISTASK